MNSKVGFLISSWTQHPSSLNVSSDTVCGSWKVKGQRLRGLTRTLERLIHEPSLYRAALRSQKKKSKKVQAGRQMYQASQRYLGTRVHRDIAMLCRKTTTPDRVHPIAMRLWSFFTAQKRWIPVASEFKVWDERHKTTTAIDAIFIDPETARLIAIEWKTGYEDDHIYTFRQGTLCLGDARLPKSIAYAHQLQLALGCAMLPKSHPGLSVDKMYVARVTRQRNVSTQQSVELLPVEPAVRRIVDLSYDLLLGGKSKPANTHTLSRGGKRVPVTSLQPRLRTPRVRVPGARSKKTKRSGIQRGGAKK